MATASKTDTKSAKGNGQMFATSVDISQKERSQVIDLLNQSLADVFDLYSQTKHAHWNVKGPNFYQLHLLFDELAEMILPFVDELGERVTALGGTAKGTARMAAGSTTLQEFPGVNGGMECVEALAQRYAAVGNDSRETIDKTDELGDMGSSDLFTDMVRTLDKALYFLEAHLQK